MKLFNGRGRWFAVAAALLGFSLPASAASLYLSVVAETFGPDAASLQPAQGHPVTYTALDGGYIESGDPVGGEHPAAPAFVESALAQALQAQGFQPAPAGGSATLLLVYNWGVIRHDSQQIQPTNHLKGNDRARLMLVSRSEDAQRIESDIVNDRYAPPGLRVGAMTRTENDRETLQLARDEHYFVVVSAYDIAGLRQNARRLVWQAKLTTRAIGHTMEESLASLITYGAPYFGRNETARQDLKENLVPPSAVRIISPVPGVSAMPANVDPRMIQDIMRVEHDTWSGRFRD